MSDTAWILSGVDPAARQRAAAEAARLGMDLSDYLTDVLAQNLGVSGAMSAARAQPSAVLSPEKLEVWQRYRALERRLHAEFSALDESVQGLACRVDETEAAVTAASEAVRLSIQNFEGDIGALRKRIIDAEDTGGALVAAHEATRKAVSARCAEIDARVDEIASVARDTAAATAELNAAHIALKHALAQDFSDLATDVITRLDTGLDEARRDAEAAAEAAEAASARIMSDMRSMRLDLSERLSAQIEAVSTEAGIRIAALAERQAADSQRAALAETTLNTRLGHIEQAAREAETRAGAAVNDLDARLHTLGHVVDRTQREHRSDLDGLQQKLESLATATGAKFDQAAAASSAHANDLRALTRRVDDFSQSADRTAQALLTQIKGVDERARTQIEETTATLRDADATLAAELAHLAHENQNALAALQSQVSEDVAGLAARQQSLLGRQKQLDAGLQAARAEAAHRQDQISERLSRTEHGLREDIAAVHADLAPRLDDLDARQSRAEHASERIQSDLGAFRQESASRLVALEASSRDALARLRSETDQRLTEIAREHEHFATTATEIDGSLKAETERVEACMLAALEKIAADVYTTRESLNETDERVDDLGKAHAGFAAGTARLAQRISALEGDIATRAVDRDFDNRVHALEAQAERAAAATDVQSLRDRVTALSTKLETHLCDSTLKRQVDALAARLNAFESQVSEAAFRLNGFERALEQTRAHTAEEAALLDQRLAELADASMEHSRATREFAANIEQEQKRVLPALQSGLDRLDGENKRRAAELSALHDSQDQLARTLAAAEAAVKDAAKESDVSRLEERVATLQKDLGERLGGLTANDGEIQKRLGEIEQAQHALLVDKEFDALRQQIQQVAAQAAPHDALRSVLERIAAVESRQADAFDAVHVQIEHFITENDRRLALIEDAQGADRLDAVSGELTSMRRRMEERLLEIEQRSVQALEQISQTMLTLEERIISERDRAGGERFASGT